MAGGGTLFVVATPIGNLGDETFRALEVLRARDQSGFCGFDVVY